MLKRPALYIATIAAMLMTANPRAVAGRTHGRSFQNPIDAQPPTIALVNGKWFNGHSFESRTVYSLKGRFTFKKPARVDQTLNLAGAWIVPPFAEAHNHNLNGTREDRDREVIRHYLEDGVFYVQIQGNLPLAEEMKRRLSLSSPHSIDAIFAQGAQLTSTGGYPGPLERVWLRSNVYAGFTHETLKDYRYFTIDSEADLDKKWPAIIGEHPNFIKVMLSASEEYDKRKGDPTYVEVAALDPHLLPKIVARAHAEHLRVSTHVFTAGDFHNAVMAGVDMIAHLPPLARITREDARLAARRRIVVITTVAAASQLPDEVLSLLKQDHTRVLQLQAPNLKLLHDSGVSIAIGSDTPGDSSLKEVEYIHNLGVFDNLTLLKMWTESTPHAIFPERKIGALKEGYEASFLALEGNPLEDFKNVARIKLRFKQGFPLEQ